MTDAAKQDKIFRTTMGEEVLPGTRLSPRPIMAAGPCEPTHGRTLAVRRGGPTR
jgi:hypothetical protein